MEILSRIVYKARGSNFSWLWLAAISLCVEALRALSRDLNRMLGKYLGQTHTTPDNSLDINKIIASLDAHNVYRHQPGRTFNNEDEPVLDAESFGLNNLMDGSPSMLSVYNQSFRDIQAAHRRPIVSQMARTSPQGPAEQPPAFTVHAHVPTSSSSHQQQATNSDNEEGMPVTAQEGDSEGSEDADSEEVGLGEPEDRLENEFTRQDVFLDIGPDEFDLLAQMVEDSYSSDD